MTSKTYSMNSLKPQKIINQSLIGLKGLGQDINLKKEKIEEVKQALI